MITLCSMLLTICQRLTSSHPQRSIVKTGLLLLAIIASAYAGHGQTVATTTVMQWKVGDTTRRAIVYIPATAKSRPAPVVFVFHGHGGNMQNMFRSRGFEKLWPEAIIVCPQGLNTPGQLTDPAGKLPGWQKAVGDMGDRDLHFFDAMLTSLQHDYKVDTKRIYATGHSNGGGFSYLLWAARGDVFAAIASSASSPGRLGATIKPKPAMHIMGEKDELVLPQWQKRVMDMLLKLNQCDTPGERYDALATRYPSASGNPVVFYVHPGGHTYPAEANAVVVKFFKSIEKN